MLNIIKDNQYDNIFHEHIGFHSLKSLIDLAKRNNLNLFDVEHIDSQGGSFRYYISNNDLLKPTKKVKHFLYLEKKYGLFKTENIEKFKLKINDHRKSLFNFIFKLKKSGKKISAYGASGKGLALLQYSKIDKNIIDHIFDKSKLKQKKYSPGTNIKILSPNDINRKKVDYLLILSWNIIKEIMKQENSFLKQGGKFIVPFPQPKIYSKK